MFHDHGHNAHAGHHGYNNPEHEAYGLSKESHTDREFSHTNYDLHQGFAHAGHMADQANMFKQHDEDRSLAQTINREGLNRHLNERFTEIERLKSDKERMHETFKLELNLERNRAEDRAQFQALFSHLQTLTTRVDTMAGVIAAQASATPAVALPGCTTTCTGYYGYTGCGCSGGIVDSAHKVK